jgi:hypothetical protein
MKLNKFMQWLSYLTIVAALFLMLYFSYLLFYPYKVVEFHDILRTTKQQYHQGETFAYAINYTKYMDLPATNVRRFVNGIVYTLPTIQTCNDKGEHNTISALTHIPRDMPPGKYTYCLTIIYKVNPFREVSYQNHSNEFEVIGE